jgi:CRP/FNR family transcriptional regulator, cyclic AMP receptor protein
MIELQERRDLAKTLSENYVFRGVAREALAGLAATAAVRTYRGGDTIVRQYDRGRDIYLILTGAASVKSPTGEAIVEFGPGSVIGEMSLIDDQPRSATVLAIGTTEVAELNGSVLYAMMENPEIRATIMTNMSRVLSRRLRLMNERARQPIALR